MGNADQAGQHLLRIYNGGITRYVWGMVSYLAYHHNRLQINRLSASKA